MMVVLLRMYLIFGIETILLNKMLVSNFIFCMIVSFHINMKKLRNLKMQSLKDCNIFSELLSSYCLLILNWFVSNKINYRLELWKPLHLITKTLCWYDIESDQYALITLSFSLEDNNNWYSCGHANGILLNK